MKDFKEIIELENLIQQFNFEVEVDENKYLASDFDYVQVAFTLNNINFLIFIQDEYEDLNEDNPALCLCLILKELEEYMLEDDYQSWCYSRKLPSGNVQVRDYYIELKTIYSLIEKTVGVIECPVTKNDFEQNLGAIKVLREKNKKNPRQNMSGRKQ